MARGIGGFVARFPESEPAFIRLGRALLRFSYPLATVYYHANGNLIGRMRRSGRRFRRVSFDGVALNIDVTDHTGRAQYFHGIPYEPALTRWLLTELRVGDVFVDVGANIGVFSFVAASVVGPTGRVVAFEPHPGARAAMVELLAQNRIGDRVEIVPAAVGDRCEGTVQLHLSFDSVLSTLNPALSPAAAEYGFDRSIDVPLTTIDQWLSDHADLAPRIAAIKIDVEGLEAEVIAGMERTLSATARARLVVETTPDSSADRRLQSAGFTRSPLDISRGTFGNYLYQRPTGGSPRT